MREVLQLLVHFGGNFPLPLLAFFKCTKFFSYSLDILNLELIFRQLFQPYTVYGNEKLETS